MRHNKISENPYRENIEYDPQCLLCEVVRVAGDGEEAPGDEPGGEGRQAPVLRRQLLLRVLKLLLLIVCHSLHEDQGEEGDSSHEVQHVDDSIKSRSHDPGGGGDTHEEEVLIEADENQVEQTPSDFCIENRPFANIGPP